MDNSSFSAEYGGVANEEVLKCKALMLAIIDRSILDLQGKGFKQSLEDKKQLRIRQEEAFNFLFEDDIYISWGDIDISFSDMCEYVGLNVTYARAQLEKKLNSTMKLY